MKKIIVALLMVIAFSGSVFAYSKAHSKPFSIDGADGGQINGDVTIVGNLIHKDSSGTITSIRLSPSALTDYGDASTTNSIEWAIDQLPQPTWKTITGAAVTVIDSGTTDSTTSNKLEDSGADWVTATPVIVGMVVRNTTDNTLAIITAVDDLNTLTVAPNIFVSGENYSIESFRVTSNGHGFSEGDSVYIRRSERDDALDGMTEINNKEYIAFNSLTNTFDLKWTDGSTWTAYITGGQVRKVNVGTAIGGVVFLECGDYIMRTELTITEDYVTLTGAGRDCVHIYADPTLSTGGLDIMINITGDFVTVSNIEVDGSVDKGSYQVISTGAVIGGGGSNPNKCKYWNYGTVVENINVHSSRTDGIVMGYCTDNFKVLNNIAHGHNNPLQLTSDNTASYEMEDGAKNGLWKGNYDYGSNICFYPHTHTGWDNISGAIFDGNVCEYESKFEKSSQVWIETGGTTTIDMTLSNNIFKGSNVIIASGTGISNITFNNNTYLFPKVGDTGRRTFYCSGSGARIISKGDTFIGNNSDSAVYSVGAIDLVSCDKGYYSDITIQDFDLRAIHLRAGSDDNIFKNITIIDAGEQGYGVGFDISSDDNIFDNIITINTGAGGSGGYGLQMRTGATGNIVKNSIFDGGATRAIYQQATDTVYLNNTGITHVYTSDGTFSEYFGEIHLSTAQIVQSLADGTVRGGTVLIYADDITGGAHTITIPKWIDPDRTDTDALDTCVFDANEYIELRWDKTSWVTQSKTCAWTDVD